jgi:hypothetical protein
MTFSVQRENRIAGRRDDEDSTNWQFLKKSLTILGFGFIICYVVTIAFEEIVLWLGWAMSTRHFSIHIANRTSYTAAL